MPMSLKPKFLQYGKDFHAVFFHAFSSNDMAYTFNRIGIIQIYWWVQRSSFWSFYLFSNISKNVDKSMVLAVVLSQVSTNSEIFKFYVESTIMYLLHKKLNKVIVPLLIYDYDVPQCLVHFEPRHLRIKINGCPTYWESWIWKTRLLAAPSLMTSSARHTTNCWKYLLRRIFENKKDSVKYVRNLICLHILAGQEARRCPQVLQQLVAMKFHHIIALSWNGTYFLMSWKIVIMQLLRLKNWKIKSKSRK